VDQTISKGPVTFASQAPNPQLAEVSDINAVDLADKKNLVHLIDVREPDEYTGELGHIDGARLITLSTVPEQLSSLPKDEPIVFICKAGGRSLQAAAFAAHNGYKYVYNLKGGMLHWNQLALPTKK
jgi:hydroxyacylglutathione hydrolase